MDFDKDFGAEKEDRRWKLLLLNFVRSSSTYKTHFTQQVPKVPKTPKGFKNLFCLLSKVR